MVAFEIVPQNFVLAVRLIGEQLTC